MKYFKKQKWRTTSNLKHYQSKTLEIILVNVKVGEKRKEKDSMEELKTFKSKTTVLPTTTLLQLYSG